MIYSSPGNLSTSNTDAAVNRISNKNNNTNDHNLNHLNVSAVDGIVSSSNLQFNTNVPSGTNDDCKNQPDGHDNGINQTNTLMAFDLNDMDMFAGTSMQLSVDNNDNTTRSNVNRQKRHSIDRTATTELMLPELGGISPSMSLTPHNRPKNRNQNSNVNNNESISDLSSNNVKQDVTTVQNSNNNSLTTPIADNDGHIATANSNNTSSITLTTKNNAVYVTKKGKKRVVCDCNQAGCLGDYADIKSLNQHQIAMNNRINNKKFKCPHSDCHKSFDTFFQLKSHVKSHNKPLVCNALDIKYNVKNINKIIKDDAKGKKSVRKCTRRFVHKTNLKLHLKKGHKMDDEQVEQHEAVLLDINLSELYAGTEFAKLLKERSQLKTSHIGNNVNSIDTSNVDSRHVLVSQVIKTTTNNKSKSKHSKKTGKKKNVAKGGRKCSMKKQDSGKKHGSSKKKKLKRRTKSKKHDR